MPTRAQVRFRHIIHHSLLPPSLLLPPAPSRFFAMQQAVVSTSAPVCSTQGFLSGVGEQPAAKGCAQAIFPGTHAHPLRVHSTRQGRCVSDVCDACGTCSCPCIYIAYLLCMLCMPYVPHVLDRHALTHVCAGWRAWGCWCIQHVIYVRDWGFGRGDFSWKGGIGLSGLTTRRVGRGKG